MTEFERKNLLQSFDTESCVLWLGPQASAFLENGETVSIQIRMAQELARIIQATSKVPIDIDPQFASLLEYVGQKFLLIRAHENGNPIVKDVDLRITCRKLYEEIFRDAVPTPLHRLIAELPFHLIINTGGDQMMMKALKDTGKYRSAVAHYNYLDNEKNQHPVPVPTVSNPLIFNLFGDFSDHNSLVITEAHRLEFIEKFISNEPRVPDGLMKHLDKSKKYIFLGFDWEGWHWKMLLQKLPFIRNSYAPASPANRFIREFFKEYFQVEFVAMGDTEFLSSLKESIAEAPLPNHSAKNIAILRAPVEQDMHHCGQLLGHLKSLPGISYWTEDLIDLGDQMENARQQAIRSADMIVLLVSVDFLNSPLLQLLPEIVEMRRSGKKVVTVVSRPCEWDQIRELTQMTRILPENGRSPVSLSHNPELIWNNISQSLIQLLSHHG